MMCEIICKLASVIFESACWAFFLKDRHSALCQMNRKTAVKHAPTGAGWAAPAAESLRGLGRQALLFGVQLEAGGVLGGRRDCTGWGPLLPSLSMPGDLEVSVLNSPASVSPFVHADGSTPQPGEN